MPDPTILVTLKSIAPHVLKAVRFGWARLPQNRPLGKAIEVVSKRYETRLPGIDCALDKWIFSDEFRAQMESIKSAPEGVTENDLEHVDRFIRISGLGFGTGSLDTVGECLTFFYSELFLQLAEGDHGMRVIAAKLEAIHRDIQKPERLPSGLEVLPYRPPLEVDTANRAITEEDRKAELELNLIKSLVDNRQGRTALSLLTTLQQRVDDGTLSAPLRFRFFANKGVCQMLIGDLDQATQELERARTLEPTNRKALLNLAMVAVCQHRYEAALSLLQAPLSQDPEDQTANAIRLASLHELGRQDELEQTIKDRPNILKDPHCLYTLAYAAFDLGRFDEAEHYLFLHNERDAKLAEAWELLGRSILVPIQQHLLKAASSPNWIPGNLRDRIEEAIADFSRAEQLLAHAETKHELIPVLSNRGVARTFLSLYDEARKDYERALDLDPSQDDVRRNLGNLALVTGKPDEAVHLFEQIQSPSKKAEAAPYMAAAYLNADEPAAARDVISPHVNKGNPNDKTFFFAFDLALHASQLLKDDSECGRLLALLNGFEEPEARRIEAEYHRRAGDAVESIRLMRTAVEKVGPELAGRYRLFLADLLFRNNLFADAAEQYELVPVPPNESPESKRYVGALFMAGRYAKTLQVARAVRGIRSALPEFSEIEARVNEASGSLDDANRLRRHLLEAGVTPALQRLKLAVNHFRRGQTDEAADLTLQVDLSTASANPELLMESARLRTLLNLPDALDFAYKLLHHELDNPEFHLFFVQTFFRREEIDRQLLNPAVAGVNCTVTLRHLDELQAVTIVAGNADMAKNWFPVDHGLVRELLGKTVGDKIRIPPGDSGMEYEIRSVQSKFVATFQECLTRFNSRFPAHYGLTRVEIGEGDITNILPQLEQRRALAERVVDLYRDARLPACTVAGLLGKSDAELFRALLHDPKTKVLSFGGSRVQIEREAALLVAQRPILVEMSALVTLRLLGVLDTVEAALGKLVVTQQSIDALAFTSMQLFPEKQGGHIFSDSPGHINVVVLKPEEVAQEKAFYDDLLKFTQTRCELVAPDQAASLEEFEKTGMQRTFGQAALSTVATAKGTGLLMLSDDLPLRTVVEGTFGVVSVSTFAVLRHLLATRYLSKDDYHRAIQWLIDHGVSFVAIDKHDLVWVLKRNGWLPTAELARLLQTLEGPDCVQAEALRLGLEVLYEIWGEPLARTTKQLLTDLVLRALMAGRNPGEILGLLQAMNSRWSLLWTPAMEEIQRTLRTWRPRI